MEKTNKEKAMELCQQIIGVDIESEIYTAAMAMAKWKDEQMMELWNVARNVYEAWMGGTMNDVRECMKDLGHLIDTFLDMSKEK